VLGSTEGYLYESRERGFTIAELIVAISAGSLVALVIFSVSLFFYADIARGEVETNMLIESQTILNDISEDMRTSSAILTTHTLSDANEPAAAWNTDNANLILIMSEPALNASRNFVLNPTTGNPYQNEFIIFVSDNQLYKRILANPSATGNRAVTTCPAEHASSSCPRDPLLTNYYKSLSFVFYDQDGVLTTNPALGRSIAINIVLERAVFGQTISVDNHVRMTLRNPYLN
jgi:hypothetical protein